jgi:hypothetical protein
VLLSKYFFLLLIEVGVGVEVAKILPDVTHELVAEGTVWTSKK